MTSEQIRLFANYLNIAAAAFMVAALVTQPAAWAIAGRSEPVSETNFVLISFGLSILFHLAAQLAIGRLNNEF